MYSLDKVNASLVTDFTDEILAKMQNVEPEKLVEYCSSINETATESARTVRDGMKTMFAKFLANVFEGESVHNALMIDLVVRKIVTYLSMKDICSCREVCRLWNLEGSAYFRSNNQKIIFHPESIKKLETFISFMKAQEKAVELESNCVDVDTYEKVQPPPYSNYSFTAQYPTTQFPRTLMHDFVNTCGQYVKKLEIFYPDDGALSAQEFKAFFLAGMPNLESIHFVNLPRRLTQRSFLTQPKPESQRQTNDKDDNEAIDNDTELLASTIYNNVQQLSAVTHLRIDRTWQLETCWKEPFLQDLLALMPNIVDYELWTWNSTTEDDHSKPYLVSLSPQNIRNLKILQPGSVGDSIGLTIAQLGLTLKKLYLPVLDGNIKATTIELLLESQQETLEELQINFSTMKDSRLLNFPRMKKLTNLHVICSHLWNPDHTKFKPHIHYPDQFPQLKSLKVEITLYIEYGYILFLFPVPPHGTTICTTLEELDISFLGFMRSTFLADLAKTFPNLKRLTMDGYGTRMFTCLFLNMQNLEYLSLHLVYGFNVDDQMTGIHTEKCADLRKKGDSMVDEFKLNEVKHYPSLRNLTKLKTLILRQKESQKKFWPDAQCITTVSGYFALAKMKQLRHIRIERVQFTDKCRRYLSQELEDCCIDFS